MVNALGYSVNEFDPAKPGRLCRGRERWIEPWPSEEEDRQIQRIVVSGAVFSDDSAADALRGLPHSRVDLASVVAALFPRKQLMAFMEDGHPADMPQEPMGVELYTGYRSGGLSEEMLVRWYKVIRGVREMRTLLGDGFEGVRGFLVLKGDEDLDALWEKVFSLVGMSTLDSPPARYQPAALPEILEVVDAVILIHRDKQGPALGIYTRELDKVAPRLQGLCDRAGALMVRFAIPPMLARWDRALSEAREEWMAIREDDFPVPPAPEASTWQPRWKRRQQRKKDAETRRAMGEE